MSDLWRSIEKSEWRRTPCVFGRTATESDVKEGRAVFYVKGGSLPAAIDLPQLGLQAREGGASILVVVVQAEHVDGRVLFGVRPLSGGNGICTSDEVELLEEPTSEGLPPNTSLERTRER